MPLLGKVNDERNGRNHLTISFNHSVFLCFQASPLIIAIDFERGRGCAARIVWCSIYHYLGNQKGSESFVLK